MSQSRMYIRSRLSFRCPAGRRRRRGLWDVANVPAVARASHSFPRSLEEDLAQASEGSRERWRRSGSDLLSGSTSCGLPQDLLLRTSNECGRCSRLRMRSASSSALASWLSGCYCCADYWSSWFFCWSACEARPMKLLDPSKNQAMLRTATCLPFQLHAMPALLCLGVDRTWRRVLLVRGMPVVPLFGQLLSCVSLPALLLTCLTIPWGLIWFLLLEGVLAVDWVGLRHLPVSAAVAFMPSTDLMMLASLCLSFCRTSLLVSLLYSTRMSGGEKFGRASVLLRTRFCLLVYMVVLLLCTGLAISFCFVFSHIYYFLSYLLLYIQLLLPLTVLRHHFFDLAVLILFRMFI